MSGEKKGALKIYSTNFQSQPECTMERSIQIVLCVFDREVNFQTQPTIRGVSLPYFMSVFEIMTIKVMETAHIYQKISFGKAQECVHLLQTKATEDPYETVAATGAEEQVPTAVAALA